MKRVYKYDLPAANIAEVEMPVGARVLHVEAQYDVPKLWALVDPDMPFKKYYFRVAGTGHDIDDIHVRPHAQNYIGSFMLHGGGLIFHVFNLND